MRLARTLNDIEGIARFGFIGTAAARAGSEPEDAAQLLAAADAALDRLGTPLSPLLQRLRDSTLTDLEQVMGSERTTRALAEGATLTPEDALKKATALLD
jgi:hypothetical protein